MRSLVALVVVLSLLGCERVSESGAEPPPPSRIILGQKSIEARCELDVVWRSGQSLAVLAPATESCEGTLFFTYAGPIDSETVEFVNALPDDPQNVMFLYLNSGGGIVADAMAVGQALWDRRVLAAVRADDECLSACIFVLAGARVRGLDGRIGIHRVFSQDPSIATLRDLREATAHVEAEAREYFQTFGVNPSIVDLMMSAPSDTMRYLSRDELYELGLGEVNVAHRELGRHEIIRRCGVAFETQVRTAEAATTQRCRPPGGYTSGNFSSAMNCRDAVLSEFGVSNYPNACN